MNTAVESSHRKISWRAILIFENFHPLIAFCHAEEITLDVGLTLFQNKHKMYLQFVLTTQAKKRMEEMSISTDHTPNLLFFNGKHVILTHAMC